VARNKTRDKTRGYARRSRVRRAGSPSWVLVVVALAPAVTVPFALHGRAAAQEQAVPANAPSQAHPTPVPPEIMKDFEGIPAATWGRAGTGGAARPTFVGDSLVAGGKPVVLYIGAGYCPYCAAARWSMIAALSRFGRFSGLTLATSSSADVFPSTPTFSFHGSRYTSPYLQLQTVELASSRIMANGHDQPLEKLTPEQEALIRKYDEPPYVEKAGAGGIPFLLVGGRYMWSGAPFTPQLLANKTQAEIAATLPTGSGTPAQAILVNANELAAAICAVDGNRPADVCSEPVVRKALEALPNKVP